MDHQTQAVAAPVARPGPAPPAPTDPGEMSASVALHLAGGRSFVATARATPAGLISVGLLVSSILLSVAVLTHVAKARPAR